MVFRNPDRSLTRMDVIMQSPIMSYSNPNPLSKPASTCTYHAARRPMYTRCIHEGPVDRAVRANKVHTTPNHPTRLVGENRRNSIPPFQISPAGSCCTCARLILEKIWTHRCRKHCSCSAKASSDLTASVRLSHRGGYGCELVAPEPTLSTHTGHGGVMECAELDSILNC